MNASPLSLIPTLLAGLPLAVLYSLLLINLRKRFGGLGVVVGAAAAIIAFVGFVALQAYRAERDHPFLVVAFVAILFLAIFATPAFVIWRTVQPERDSVSKQVVYGVLGFYGGILIGGAAGMVLLYIVQATGGGAV